MFKWIGLVVLSLMLPVSVAHAQKKGSLTPSDYEEIRGLYAKYAFGFDTGDAALVVYRLGVSWGARSMSWRLALQAPVKRGRVLLKLRDPAAPMARLTVSGVQPWPPEFQSEELAA